MSEDIERKVKEILVEQLGVEDGKITLDSKIVEDLGADSLDLAELIMELEEAYKIEISDEEAKGLRKVGDIIKYIEEHKKY